MNYLILLKTSIINAQRAESSLLWSTRIKAANAVFDFPLNLGAQGDNRNATKSTQTTHSIFSRC